MNVMRKYKKPYKYFIKENLMSKETQVYIRFRKFEVFEMRDENINGIFVSFITIVN